MKKNVFRQMLALLCTVLLAFSSAVALPASAAETGENDKFSWTLDENGGATITGIKTDLSHRLVIPDSVEGAPVVSLGFNPFWGAENFTFDSIFIPATVETIDPGFLSSYSHQGSYFTQFEVAEKNSCFKAVDGVLYSKDGTTLVRFPLGRTGSFTVPSGVKEIGKYAFWGCAVTELTLNEGLVSLGDSAFYQLPITSLRLPSTLTGVGKNVFSGCHIAAITLAMDTIPQSLIENYSDLRSVTLEEGVREIGMGAFKSCNYLESIVFPSSLEIVGESAFDFCFKLASVSLNEGLKEIGKYAFRYCGIQEIQLPSTLERIGHGAFTNTHISAIEFPASVAEIGDYAFSSSALTAVTVPAGVTNLGGYVFSYCEALESAVLETGRTSVPNGTFKGCKTLSSVELPETVKEIGDSAFDACSILPEIALPEGLTQLGARAFQNCLSLDRLVIPEGVTELKNSALSFCWSLREITLPQNLRTIDSFAFQQCKSLQSLHLPAGLERFGVLVFDYTPALQEVLLEGDAPALVNNQPIDPFWSEDRTQPLKLYVREEAAGYDKSPWTEYGDRLIVLTEPDLPEPTAIPTSLSFTAELERSPQDDLILWLDTSLAYDESLLEDAALRPAGAFQFYRNGSLWTPRYFVSGNSTRQGFSVKSYLGQTLELKAVFTGSRGFQGSESGSAKLKISVDTMVQSVEERIRTLPGHLPGEACESPEERGIHQKQVSDAYYAYTSLNYLDVRQMDAGLCQKVREQYRALIDYLRYVTSTSDQSVEVVGVTESVTLPEGADTIELAVEPVEQPADEDAKTALETAAAAASAEHEKAAQVACYDIKLMAANSADGSRLPVQPDENKAVAVKVKLPGDIDTNTLKIFHIKDGVAEPEEMPFVLTEDGGGTYAVVESASFSYFAFFAEPNGGAQKPGERPDTKPEEQPDKRPEEKPEEKPNAEPGQKPGSHGNTAASPSDPLERFTDVEGHWAAECIAYAVEKGLLAGTSETAFSPEGPMSRGMVVTVLWRLAGEPEPAVAAPFADVEPGRYYSKAAAWAAGQKLTNGMGQDLFQPSSDVSRQDLAIFLYRYGKWARLDVSKTAALSQFTDGDSIASYAQAAASWCAAEGILSGQPGGYFAPEDTATRAETAKMLRAFCVGPGK